MRLVPPLEFTPRSGSCRAGHESSPLFRAALHPLPVNTIFLYLSGCVLRIGPRARFFVSSAECPMRRIEEIRPLLEKKLRTMGLDLYEIKCNDVGRHSVLRVHVDKPGGVTIADCERASRDISVLLDVSNLKLSPDEIKKLEQLIDKAKQRKRGDLKNGRHE